MYSIKLGFFYFLLSAELLFSAVYIKFKCVYIKLRTYTTVINVTLIPKVLFLIDSIVNKYTTISHLVSARINAQQVFD